MLTIYDLSCLYVETYAAFSMILSRCIIRQAARQLVVAVAERYGLLPLLLTDNVVRFGYHENEP